MTRRLSFSQSTLGWVLQRRTVFLNFLLIVSSSDSLFSSWTSLCLYIQISRLFLKPGMGYCLAVRCESLHPFSAFVARFHTCRLFQCIVHFPLLCLVLYDDDGNLLQFALPFGFIRCVIKFISSSTFCYDGAYTTVMVILNSLSFNFIWTLFNIYHYSLTYLLPLSNNSPTSLSFYLRLHIWFCCLWNYLYLSIYFHPHPQKLMFSLHDIS